MNATFDYTPWHSPITLVVGLVVAGTDETDLIPMGTAFLCAPYVALTARHVIDEIFHRFAGCSPTTAKGLLGFGVQFANRQGTALLKWDVMDYGYSSSVDIAALILDPPDDLPADFAWHLPRFEALPPSVGDRITSFGFPNSTYRVEADGSSKVGLDPHTTSGDVVDVHHQARDSAILPFPCLHTNAVFDPGASGGPVFNSAGHICGLVSSSMPPDSAGGDYSSYVSLIWPSLGLGLNVSAVSPHVPTKRYFLKSLVEQGEMQMLHADWIDIENGQEEARLRLRPPRALPSNAR